MHTALLIVHNNALAGHARMLLVLLLSYRAIKKTVHMTMHPGWGTGQLEVLFNYGYLSIKDTCQFGILDNWRYFSITDTCQFGILVN